MLHVKQFFSPIFGHILKWSVINHLQVIFIAQCNAITFQWQYITCLGLWFSSILAFSWFLRNRDKTKEITKSKISCFICLLIRGKVEFNLFFIKMHYFLGILHFWSHFAPKMSKYNWNKDHIYTYLPCQYMHITSISNFKVNVRLMLW